MSRKSLAKMLDVIIGKLLRNEYSILKGDTMVCSNEENRSIISDLLELARQIGEYEQAYILLKTLPSCNECASVPCGYRPSLGEPVRYNCYFFQKSCKATK